MYICTHTHAHGDRARTSHYGYSKRFLKTANTDNPTRLCDMKR